MTVTITGGRYSGSVTSLTNSYQLNNSSGGFNPGDFIVGRIVGLWNSDGATYKGVAWIRRWLSSTQLELVAPFIDRDGNAVAQTVGDTYLVSKNFTDVATTNIVVSGSRVAISEDIVFGTNGSTNSCCFYDENKFIDANVGSQHVFLFRGGLTIFGKLNDFSSRSTSNPCSIVIRSMGAIGTGTTGDQIKVANAAAKVAWFGGEINCEVSPSRLFGGNSSTSPPATPGEFQDWWNISVTNADIISPDDGSDFSSDPTRQRAVNLSSFISGLYNISIRWGNGYLEGGRYIISGNSPLAFTGKEENNAVLAVGAPAGQFLTILDGGTGTQGIFWTFDRTGQTLNCTNVVCPNTFRIPTRAIPPVANTQATINFRFSGLYTNLINGSLGLIKNNNLLTTVQDSGTAASNRLTLTVQEATVSGGSETVIENSWVYGIYLYGYSLVAGSFATATTALTAGQAAKQVVFGGPVAQIIDVNITQSTAATVAAYTQLENSDKAYDYAQYWKALNTTNAIYPAYNQQLIANNSGTLSTPGNNNIVFDSAAGSVFSVNTSGQGTITFKSSGWTSTTKSDTFQLSASRTLTFSQAGDKSGFRYLIPSNGTVVVASGSTNLRNSVFTNGATINVSSGTATVTVDASQVANITAGSGVTLQTAPRVITIQGFQPGSDVVISQAGRTLDRLNNTSPPFVWSVSGITVPSSVALTIYKTGYEIYTQTIQVIDADQGITVAQVPAGSTDTFNSPEFEFKSLMIVDAGFKRILAGGTGSLIDDAAACRLAQFESSAVKASWNLLVAATVPTALEISTWQGYLVTAGYSAISFANGTGVVS